MNQQATLSASLLAKFPVLEKIRALPKPVVDSVEALWSQVRDTSGKSVAYK